jgi:signal transduction histidine kinase
MSLDLLSDIIIVFVVLSGLTIAFWSYLGDRKNIINKLFFVFVNIIILNIVFSYLFKISYDLEYAELWVRLVWVTASLLIPSLYLFSVYFPTKIHSSSFINILFVAIGLVFAVLSTVTDIFVKDVALESQGLSIVTGDYINVYYSILIASVVYCLFVIFHKYLNVSRTEKQKIIYLLYGIAIFVTANIIFGVVLPTFFNESRYLFVGDYSVIFFIGLTAYAIVKNHLFDVKSAIIRSVTYISVLLILALIYLALALSISTLFDSQPTDMWDMIGAIAISLALAFAFQPIKKFFDKVTDKIFYKNGYNLEDFYERINDALTLNTDLRDILKRTSEEIKTTVKCEQAFFHVHTDDEHYASAGTKDHARLSPMDIEKVAKACGKNRKLLLTHSIEKGGHIGPVLRKNGIEITLPLVQSKKTIGYLFLGEHLASGYNNRDIRALDMISDELTIAISNALSVQKVLELNATLQQKVADATKELKLKNKRLISLDKAKDEFVSVAAHELRTPMTVIRGFVDLLEREQLGPVNDKQKEILSKMGSSAKNLIDLVGNMLDLSKLEANRLEINQTDVNLDDLVASSLDKVSLLYEEKGVTLNYTGKNVKIYTDPDKFERVLVNLLSNAFKFTPAGGSVTVSNAIDSANHKVIMCVADTGIGITADGINSLFKKFSQVDNYLQKTSGGTGLGLSICKQIVEKMGGEIWVESKVGKGSRFYYSAPTSKA